MTTVPDDLMRARSRAGVLVELACRAPSMHNTQPWSWRVTGTTIELSADRGRQLRHADPDGRNLLISCGSALHHAQVAARGLGWKPHVTRHPEPDHPNLLARIELEPTPVTPVSQVDLQALWDRCTDRRRFTSWPVDAERLLRLVDVARSWGGDAEAVTEVVLGLRVEHLVSRAYQAQAGDSQLAAEQQGWLDHSAEDGVPSAVVPLVGQHVGLSRRPRFERGSLVDGEREVVSTDGLLVLVGGADDDASWLATGEALGGVWLSATLGGLSILPLSQVVEVPETRAALQHDVLGGGALPHLLLRVGWQQISRHPLGRTPRRALADILHVEAPLPASSPR